MPIFVASLRLLTTALMLIVLTLGKAQADPTPDPAVPALLPDAHATPFEEMLAHVYQENPRLRSERENLRLLDEKVSEATAGFRPSLALTGAVGEARVSIADQSWRYGHDYDAALTATQPIYNGAAIGQWHAARKRVMEGRAHLEAVEQKVLLAAIAAWIDMCEQESLLALTRDNARMSQDFLNQTRQRQAAGDGTQTDIAIAVSRAAEGETRYAMAEAARDAARAGYEKATGLHAQQSELPPLPAGLPDSADETARLAKRNPDLVQAEYEVAATSDDIDSATGARLPFIYLKGTVSDETAEELGLSRLRGDSITVNASFPLYQGGIEYTHVREAKIAHEKSRFDSLAASRDIAAEALGAWSRFRAAQTVIKASDSAAEASDRALAGIAEEQKHGARTLTEVLDAQLQTLNTRITALQAQTDLRLAAYRLMAVTGKLTASGLGLPVTVYDPAGHYDDVAGRWFGTSVAPGNAPEVAEEP